MAKYATGKRSQAISDRSGMAFPYTEMVKEWNGSFVHTSEFEPKHPQIRRRHQHADAIALRNSRNMKFQQPAQKFPHEITFSDSGGASVGVANLSLPGDFAFITSQPSTVLTNQGVAITTMAPANPSEQNRKRRLLATVGTITVSIS